MKIFISWSEEASRRVAHLLRKYLPCMIQDLSLFMSQHDLSSGRRWSEQLSEELEQSSFGIVCLTPENLQSPWILFEAGALTKHVSGRACCLLLRGLGPADVSGPLSQFQNRAFSRDGFQKLLIDINHLLERPLEQTSLQMIFEKWWADLEREVTTALSDPQLDTSSEHKRDQTDLLEELLLRVRDIQRAFERKGSVEMNQPRLSIRERLTQMLLRLSPQQVALLREFVTPKGSSLVLDARELESKYSSDDIEDLIKSRILVRHNDSLLLFHDVMARYIAESFPTFSE